MFNIVNSQYAPVGSFCFLNGQDRWATLPPGKFSGLFWPHRKYWRAIFRQNAIVLKFHSSLDILSPAFFDLRSLFSAPRVFRLIVVVHYCEIYRIIDEGFRNLDDCRCWSHHHYESALDQRLQGCSQAVIDSPVLGGERSEHQLFQRFLNMNGDAAESFVHKNITTRRRQDESLSESKRFFFGNDGTNNSVE